jgi:uncharacterized protein YdeI (YjbR/CyaY-like superfamily)
MSAFDDAPLFEPESRAAWRAWLRAHHTTASGVWLVSRRIGLGAKITYEEAVEEALCVGWVDSRGGKVDDERSKLYFAPRKARSGWADTNKARIERLTAAGLMLPAGIAAVERAKADGSWSVLDGAIRAEVPADLDVALAARPPAREHWDAFPHSIRRAILGWIALARRPETRAKRIEETATNAEHNARPKQFQPGD